MLHVQQLKYYFLIQYKVLCELRIDYQLIESHIVYSYETYQLYSKISLNRGMYSENYQGIFLLKLFCFLYFYQYVSSLSLYQPVENYSLLLLNKTHL